MTHENETRQSRKSLIGFGAALMLGAALAFMMSQSASLLESGTPAPNFELPAVGQSDQVSLESLQGKVVLIDFWSTSCQPCIRQMQELEVIHNQMDENDFVILGINTEGAPSHLVREFTRAQGVQYTVLMDRGAVSERYRVERLPTMYLLDREGNIRWSRVGYVPHRELAQVIRELI